MQICFTRYMHNFVFNLAANLFINIIRYIPPIYSFHYSFIRFICSFTLIFLQHLLLKIHICLTLKKVLKKACCKHACGACGHACSDGTCWLHVLSEHANVHNHKHRKLSMLTVSKAQRQNVKVYLKRGSLWCHQDKSQVVLHNNCYLYTIFTTLSWVPMVFEIWWLLKCRPAVVSENNRLIGLLYHVRQNGNTLLF